MGKWLDKTGLTQIKGLLATKFSTKVDKYPGAGAGKYLQTDNNGNAFWGDPVSVNDIRDAAEDWLEANMSNIDSTVLLDTSLTTTGAAADAKSAGDLITVSDTTPTSGPNKLWIKRTPETEVTVPTYDEFTDLKSALNANIDVTDYTWVLGSMNPGSGSEYSTDTRIRSNFIRVTPNSVITFGGADKCIDVFVYNKPDTSGYQDDTGWIDENRYVIGEGISYARILLRKNTSNSSITSEEVSGIVAKCSIMVALPEKLYQFKEDTNTKLNVIYAEAKSIEKNEKIAIQLGSWEIGTINTGTGQNQEAGNRIRTIDYIDITMADSISFSIDTGYKYLVCLYDSNNNKVSATDAWSWQTSAKTWKVNGIATKLRMLVALGNDGTAYTSYADYLTSQFTSILKDTVDDLKEAVSELQKEKYYRIIHQSDMSSGYNVQSNGVKVENENYVYIESIPVMPKQTIIMTAYFGGTATNSGGISGWDINGLFKQRVFDGPINGNPTDARTQYTDKAITIPDGVYYIAFSSRVDGSKPIELKLQEINNPVTEADETIKKHEIVSGEGTIFNDEVKASIEAVQTVLASSGVPMLTMAVFTDLHHDPKYANDPTNDMMTNIKVIFDRLHFDALMNLGDAIDGQYQTQYQAEGCISDVVNRMYKITDRSHNLIGNHDDNIQSTWNDRGGYPATERLTMLEINDALFKGSRNEIHNENHLTDYYMDFEEYGIRVICVGIEYTTYSLATKTWLENVALNTDKAVLVFSHCATKAAWGYDSDIHNGDYIEEPLNDFVEGGGTVIAFIHGHTHGDMIETDASISFTEVAIGCAKFEKLGTSHTSGITYQDRSADDYTKILFDVVCVDQTNSEVHFIRCGAGSDRYISY